MIPDELRALADRVVACRHWRPMRGMRDLQGRTWTPDLLWRWHPHDRPDLTDPATVGCLLALVREAWADECAGHTYDEFWNGWFFKSRVRDGDGGNVRILGQFRSETETLVAALEAAP